MRLGPQYTVPGGGAPGGLHRRSKTMTVPESGRVVAIGGHLHGGSHELRVTQPACGNRTLAVNDPTYGAADDPLYAVHPVLHESDPKSISWTQWGDGWALRAGEKLRVTATYDGSSPHMRVMGIADVYLAPDGSVPHECAPPPTQGTTLGPDFEGRADPPKVKLTLAQWSGRGRAKLIDRPPGRIRRTSSIPRGAALRWRFCDRYTETVRGRTGFSPSGSQVVKVRRRG